MSATPKHASDERRITLLRAASRVAKSVASILDPDELLRRTVDIICEEFGFYYAGVFLLDPTGRWAILRAGHGEAGLAMIAAGHKLVVGGNSMIGAATGRREARIALDVGEEAVFFRNPYLPHTRSEMALPLIAGNDVIGALTVQSVEEAAFTQEDIETLQSMSDQLAIAIQNSRLHRQNQEWLAQAGRRARLLEAAAQVGKQVASILDLDELLPKTVDIICEAYGFYYAGVFLIDASGRWAVLRAGHGAAGRHMLERSHKLEVGGNSMIGAATGLLEARIAPDVDAERVHYRNPHLPHTRSEMALPLVVNRQVLGAVTVQSVEEHAFNADDILTLQTMADHLAIAINNAMLLKELERANAELLRTKTYEALATATTQAIHWIGNKALPITTTIARLKQDVQGETIDRGSLLEDLTLIDDSARLIVEVKEQLLGPAREQKPRPAMIGDLAQAAAYHAGIAPDALEIHIADGTPLTLADTTQLSRAFGNLFRNAREASAKKIKVNIAPSSEAGQIAVDVVDDGEGIAPDMLEKMWAAFITSKGPSHTGLGLPATLQVIAQHEGHVAAESQVGQGATFHLSLPVNPEAEAPADLSDAPAHIALIDDDDDWARYLASTLGKAGKRISRYTSVNDIPADADLILVDEALYALDLATVINDLKQAGLAGKAFILAAAPKVERTTNYLKAGIKDVVLKPYTPAELRQRLMN
jgi:GAF domain-containing protein